MTNEPHKAAPDDQDTFNDQPEVETQANADFSAGAPDSPSAPAEGLAVVNELKDKYLRLMAEFENYKRRTSKERVEMFKTANQELMLALLPVLDDFERARQHTRDTADAQAVRDGLEIIWNRLSKTLQQKGLQGMEVIDAAFDPELHEAITQIPAPVPAQRGLVIDSIERGYYLNDKVLRHAKVVLGS